MYSVSQVIEQLLVANPKSESNDAETICECSLGSLKFNTITDLKYETEGQCTKRAICHFVATEKHKARTSTKHFIRHKEFNEKRKAAKKKPQEVIESKRSGQKTLLDFLS